MQESMFDENQNLHVPIEMVLDQMMERNTQLSLEVATLKAGNQMLRERMYELEAMFSEKEANKDE